MSRLREFPEKLFEVFLEVGKPTGEDEVPFIIQKYPLDYEDQEVLKSAPKFAFPCDTERYQTTVDHFTFTLTDLESKFKFGFCRHATGAQTGFCIISFLPWFEVFYSFLNVLAEITNRSEENDLTQMLRSAYVLDVPGPGVPVTIVANQEMFSFKAPEANKLPSIPASRNLTEYYNAIDVQNMMVIFASMLHERRIVVVSKKLSRLTAVVHAAASLLYPMFWQHLFIPVLPSVLIDYLTAPMPFVIGVHCKLMEKVKEAELGDAVIVDADKNEVSTEYDDLEDLPDEVSSYLKRHLKGDKVKNSMQGTGDVISKTFMMSLVKLIGGYRDALKFTIGETITFNPEAFVQSRPASMQPFLQNMLCLQIFQQFINDRLDMLNCGRGFEDTFEQECLLHADKMNAQTRYNEWLQRMKKQGKKLQKGSKDVWSDFKDKAVPVVKEARGMMQFMTHRAGPAMSSAVESVKVQGKKVVSRAKTKFSDLKKEDSDGSPKSTKSVRHGSKTKSFSKGMTSGISKDRPSTIMGTPLSTQRPPRPPQTQRSDETPSRSKPAIVQPMSERISRTTGITEVDYRMSSDDTDVLRYSRVSCNLLSDPDLQQAMFKSASAENIPKANTILEPSDSSGTITSESSADIGEEQGTILYMDGQETSSLKNRDSAYISFTNLLDDDDSGIVMRTGSQSSLDKSRSESNMRPELPAKNTKLAGSNSDSKLPPPRPAPRSSVSPNTGNMSDRLIKPSAIRERPQPAPRRHSMEKTTEQSNMDDILINLETPSEEKGQLSLTAQFDSVEVGGEYVTLRQSGTAPSRHSENRRSSITRTPAIKLPSNETPKRPNIRRERSPVSTDEDSPQTGTIIDFDPLCDQSGSPELSQRTVAQSSVHGDSNNSSSLLMDWNIKDLTSMTNTPSQSSYPYGYSTPPSRMPMNMNNLNNFYTPPQQYPQPARVSLNFQNQLGSINTRTPPPNVPPRPHRKGRPSMGVPTSQGHFLPPKSNESQESVNSSDPFSELVNLTQPVQPSTPANQSTWQTFD